MKIFSKIKAILSSACVIFTLIFTAVYTLGMAVNIEWIPTLSVLYSILAFSVILSFANAFLSSNLLVLGVRLIIHYAISAVSFYVLFIVASGYFLAGGNVLTIMIAFTVIYAIFAAVWAIVKSTKPRAKKEKKQTEQEYKKMF